jgi:hypothetical protein
VGTANLSPELEAASAMDRWGTDWPNGQPTTMLDRLGDASSARYRHLRNFVEGMDEDDDRLDHALVGLLLTVESVRDEMVTFEKEGSALVRLAQTGHYVQQLQRMNRALDSVSAACSADEPTEPSDWGKVLGVERAERSANYDRLLEALCYSMEACCEDSDDAGHGVDQHVASVLCDLQDETRQEEVLTLLKFAVDKYEHDDVLMPEEVAVMLKAFHLVATHCNLMVMTFPSWFVAPFEFRATFGLSRWGNDVFIPDHSNQTQLIKDANTWSRLNHPHVAKFLSACHVGSQPFIVHEKLRSLSGYVVEVFDLENIDVAREKSWCRLHEIAMGLQFLHHQGLMCKRLEIDDVYCAGFEDRAVVRGCELVTLEGTETDVSSKTVATHEKEEEKQGNYVP